MPVSGPVAVAAAEAPRRSAPRPRFPGLRRLVTASACAAGICAARSAHADATQLPPQVAYNYGENDTARAAAMGGALRALGSGTTAMFMNPADMVETRVYHIDAFAQITPEAARQVYGGSIVDSVTGRLAGGIAVTGGFLDPDGVDRSQLDVRISLAYPISDKLFLGLGGRYAKIGQDPKPRTKAGRGGAPFGAGDIDKAAGGLVDPEGGRFALVNTVTFDAGLTARLGDSVYVGIVGQNLSYPNNALLPTTFGGGIGYGTKDFGLEVDGLADFNSFEKTTARFMVGGEYLAGDHFPLRVGYRFDQGADIHWLSAGSGYIGKEFSIEASVRRSLSDPGATMIVIGLAYFLESSGLTRAPTDFE